MSVQSPRPAHGSRARPRSLPAAALVVAILAAACGSTSSAAPAPSGAAVGAGPATTPERPGGTAAITPTPTPVPSPTAVSTPTPSPTPAPTPELAVAPLTGRLVAPDLAARRPIAVMVDDHWNARPQSGFNAASVVWQAPAEGGIPRYMMVFAEGDPPAVGPVRSARVYFVEWAAEWDAVYVHVGGSPGAMTLLRQKGQGQLVYDADEFRWGRTHLWRTTDRRPPHNVYTDGEHLRALAERLGADDVDASPAWSFVPDAPLGQRPAGARIDLADQLNRVAYRYHRPTNTWRRSVGGKGQRDAADNRVVAPANVVIMEVAFGSLGANQKGRLEAANVGKGRAWIAANGIVTKGTWRKDSVAEPTRFYDAAGQPAALAVGQTFVQVIPPGTPLKIVAGKRVVNPPQAAGRAAT